MNARTRRARRILRSARRGPWGKGRNGLINAMQPVHGTDGEIHHYTIVTDPWYTCRRGYYRSGNYRMLSSCVLSTWPWRPPFGPKSRQTWLKSVAKSAQWDMDHALSDCCGWGKEEVYHETIEFVGSITPTRNRMQNFKE